MAYLEAYVLPVVSARFDDYAEAARKTADLWLELGALSVVEARADNPPLGTVTSFPRSVHLAEGEEVILSLLTFRDRAHRDDVMKAMFEDPRMMVIMENVPVDGLRMFWGGFTPFVTV